MRYWCPISQRSGAVAILGFVVLAMALVTGDVSPAHANATQYGYFKAAYPSSPLSGFASTAPSNGCLVCHPTTAGPGATPAQFLNAYGTAYAALPHATQSAAIAALHSIDSANSDNDGPTITVSKAGTGSGTVTSSPGGIGCGATCTASFAGVSSAITLTATPADGSTFTGWTGGGTPDCSGTGTCAVRSDNRTEIDLGTFPSDSGSRPTITVTATFTAQAFNYSLANSGSITVTQGASGSTTITATLTAGATQSVSLLASGLPSGATQAFSAGACTPTCTSQLTINTTGSTPTGTFPITVTGTPLSRTTSVSLTVGAVPPGADLVVTALTAPTTGTIGGMIVGTSATVNNQGSTVAGPYRLGFYYSIDPTITTGDVFSGSFCNMPPLNPGQTMSCTGPVAVPGSLSPGTYHLGAFVDDLQAVPEANEQNNARAADTGPITLTGAGTSVSLSLNQTVFAAGDILNLTMTTQPGPLNGAADFYLVLLIPGGSAYLFDGSAWALIFDGTDVFPGAVKPFRASAPVTTISEIILGEMVPGSIPPGTYTFLVVLVRAGADPLDASNWLAPPGQAAFSF